MSQIMYRENELTCSYKTQALTERKFWRDCKTWADKQQIKHNRNSLSHSNGISAVKNLKFILIWNYNLMKNLLFVWTQKYNFMKNLMFVLTLKCNSLLWAIQVENFNK